MGRNLMKMWHCNYGQLVGISHGALTPCQDYAYSTTKHGVTVAVLSDGCGSSALSQYGSKATCDAVVDLFTNDFNRIIKLNPFELRKLIVDSIIKNILTTVNNNFSVFEQYRNNDPKAQNLIMKTSLENYYLSLTYATVLFVACKDNIAYVGQIGDGVVGIIENNKLKIYLEEDKEGEINVTTYPANIYTLGKENVNWYKSNNFRLNRIKINDVSGFVLTSDGVDALFDKRTRGQCKYSNGCVNLIRNIVKKCNFDKSQRYLNNLLIGIVQRSTHYDDCSISVIAKKNAIIDGKIVKDYINNSNNLIEPLNIQYKKMYIRKIHNGRIKYKSSGYINISRTKK